MYRHAVGTAQVAEQLAHRTRRVSPALAYMAGLLHDIGKVVLDQFVIPRRPFFYRDIADAIDYLAVEARHIGTDHTQAGRWLAQDWGLPAPFVETITHHHGPENAAGHVELVHMVYIADLVMSAFNAGLELERVNIDRWHERLRQVGLARGDLPAIVDRLPATIFNPLSAGADDA
jgi:putative nucleotidyltransferase with HDIG domain